MMNPCRVVRSSKTLQRQLRAKECWYIITNDKQITREVILKIYYHHFEIEETFKDLKHLLTFKPRWFTKARSFQMIVWFQVIGFWLLAYVQQYVCQMRSTTTRVHPHQWCSWVRQMFELITRERTKQLAITYYLKNTPHAP